MGSEMCISARPTPMIAAARNRRATFDSYEAAIERYASKPPMQFFDADILRAYVEQGFTPIGAGAGVELRCAPEHEARTFETGGTPASHTHLTLPTNSPGSLPGLSSHLH